MNVATFVIQALLVLYTSRYLHLSAGLFGTALGLGALGELAGVVTADRLTRKIGTGRTIAAGAVLGCAPLAALPAARLMAGQTAGLVALLAAVEFVSASGTMWFDINNNAVRTVVTDGAMRSGVSGAYSTVSYGIRRLGAVVGGILAGHIGLPATFDAAAALGTLGVPRLITTAAQIRRIEDLRSRSSNTLLRGSESCSPCCP